MSALHNCLELYRLDQHRVWDFMCVCIVIIFVIVLLLKRTRNQVAKLFIDILVKYGFQKGGGGGSSAARVC
jgi:hypothetical protein